MPAPMLDDIQRDELALAVARALAAANAAMVKQGVDPASFFVRIDEDLTLPSRTWQVHYIPRDYLTHRGGGFTVAVEEQSGKVQSVLRGQ